MDSRGTIDNQARRHALRLGLGALCATVAQPVQAALTAPAKPRALSFQHLHTGERTSLVYWADGTYIPGALDEIDHLLRDFRTGGSIPMDRALYDLLFALSDRLEANAPFHVISGYRSPATNGALARKSSGVARKSLHQVGKAIDIRIPGIPLRYQHRAARSLKLGGVGYYPRSRFVHVDTGRVRYW